MAPLSGVLRIDDRNPSKYLGLPSLATLTCSKQEHLKYTHTQHAREPTLVTHLRHTDFLPERSPHAYPPYLR